MGYPQLRTDTCTVGVNCDPPVSPRGKDVMRKSASPCCGVAVVMSWRRRGVLWSKFVANDAEPPTSVRTNIDHL